MTRRKCHSGGKFSGYGRFGGKAGIDSFTEIFWITIELNQAITTFDV